MALDAVIAGDSQSASQLLSPEVTPAATIEGQLAHASSAPASLQYSLGRKITSF
jgi:hypothetical protein